MVSGCRKMQKMVAAPASAVCSQKISRQLRNVTMMPPMKGPSAGPTSVPDRKRPRAVARSVLHKVSRSFWHRSGEEPYRFVNVSNNGRPNDQKDRALKCGENSKYEKGREIRRQSGSNGEGSEQRSTRY